MKILSLDFKNINSLKGDHHIDFTADVFTQSPLFAITGPTGSGKTTILDVISLAIFGEVPRLGKISKTNVDDSGAVLTRNQEEAFAKVVYSCKAGKFASVWTISTARTGNLRDHDMELYQLDPMERLDLKKSEVPGKNEELIGLSYDQFIKSVVLAQGEFSRFLKARKKERSELLEKITGTGIYRELGILVFRKFTDKKNEITAVSKFVESEKEKLLSPEVYTEKQEKLRHLHTEIAEIELKYKQTEAQIRLKLEWQSGNALLTKRKEDLAEEEHRHDTFLKSNKSRIEDHEAVQELTADLQYWKHQNQEISNLRQETEQLKKRQTDLRGQQKTQLDKIEEFTGESVTTDTAEETLKAFYVKINELQRRKREKLTLFQLQCKAFERETEDLQLGINTNQLVKNKSEWTRIRNQIEQEKLLLKQYFKNHIPKDIDKLIEETKTRQHLLKNAQRDQISIQNIKQEIVELRRQIKEIAENLNPVPQQLSTLDKDMQLQHKELELLRKDQQLQLQTRELEQLRQQLADGEACPLCGSLQHPYTTHLPPFKNELEEKIKSAEQKWEALNSQKIRMETQQSALQQQKAAQLGTLGLKEEKLQSEEQLYRDNYQTVAGLEEKNWEQKIGQVTEDIEQLTHFKGIYDKIKQTERADPIFNELLTIYEEGDALRYEIESYYRGKEEDFANAYQELQSSWQKMTQQLEFIHGQLTDFSRKEAVLIQGFEQFQNRLIPKLRAKGFENISTAQGALLAADQYKALKSADDHFQKQIIALRVEIKSKEEQQGRLLEQITTTTELDVLKTIKTQLEEQLREKNRQKSEEERLLKNNEEQKSDIEKKEEQLALERQKNLRWELLNSMIGDAQGNNFNQLAQDMTMRRLLVLANKRLRDLSDRYRLVVKPQHEKNKDDLVVADLDMGGQERTVQTLSGGETFLLSLALALALSDLASKNINIDSLFIDEGFGTLDPETLDQTLDTLERLQASSNKTIGIISHVDSLKERIGTQIRLKKDGSGYSSLKIVSA